MPLRVAVVGSGPAGFYAAGALLGARPAVEVDMIERLPTPWGLVRLGVAPDHPNIKAVSRAFERIAAQPGFRFFGNVEVGSDVTHEELARLYDAVVYAVGAQTDRPLGIPGEELPGSWPATEFVAWYNGHPDFQDLEFDLSGERAVVVGAGNVALDVARMLALAPEELAPTDTTDAAIDAIVGSGIREIVLLARRGPAQAAFTTPELKELGELAGADVVVDPAELELDAASAASLEDDTNAHAERGGAARVRGARADGQAAPDRAALPASRPSRSSARSGSRAIEIVQQRARRGRRADQRAEPTDGARRSRAGIVFRSVGYRGVALPGRSVRRSARRRSRTTAAACRRDGEPLAGVYCAGWIKRGPSGVIGTNKKDATETVELLLEDAAAGRLARAREPRDLEELLAERGVELVDLRRLGGDRRATSGPRASRTAGRASSSTLGRLLAAAR